MLLSTVLQKEHNNLDIFRIIAACMVIYGHAYALLPIEGQRDIIAQLSGFDYSGSLAVKLFFFLSGLLVTRSLIEKRAPRQFIISRFFRLWPALAVVLAVWAFILGPIFSDQPVQDYFANPAVYDYFLKGLVMNIHYDLPGVFGENAFKSVNGSLWSIPFEVYAYSVLIALFLTGILNSKRLSVGIFALIVIDPLISNKLLFTWLSPNSEIIMLAPCFALGSLFALFKNEIKVHVNGVTGLWLLCILFKESTYNFYFFYLAFFYSVIYISSRTWLLRIKPHADISYGIYLWGWPVQQIMAHYFPDFGIGFNQISSILISAFLGYVSWHIIESRCIKIGLILTSRQTSKKLEKLNETRLTSQ